MDVNFRCKQCGHGHWVEEFDEPSAMVCRSCQNEQTIDPSRGLDANGKLKQCWVCGCDWLYRQRDFNRKLGVGIVAVAAIFSVKTYGLSLLVAAIIDALLYWKLSEIALCYHCETIHRGFKLPESIQSYDLATHERYEDQDWGKRVQPTV